MTGGPRVPYYQPMPTRATLSAMTDEALIATARALMAHLDPAQQRNRDFILDVVGPATKRPSLRGHVVSTEILEYLA